MIKFHGELSEKCKQYLLNKATKSMSLIAIITTIILNVPVIVAGIIWSNWIFLFLVVCILIGVLLPSDIIKNAISNMPKTVIIEDGIVSISIEATMKHMSRKIVCIKEIIDVGEWYHIKFYFGHKSLYFVCQKNLLVKGSIEEFETLFQGKIIRKIK